MKSAPYPVNETNFNIVGELIKVFDPTVCENRTIELNHFYMPVCKFADFLDNSSHFECKAKSDMD